VNNGSIVDITYILQIEGLEEKLAAQEAELAALRG
jgi:hypothetical protein